MTHPVRLARPEDRQSVIDVGVAAFVSEPAFEFFFGDDYDTCAPLFLGFLFDLRMATGEVWVGKHESAVASVAMWNLPANAAASARWEQENWVHLARSFSHEVNRRLDTYEEFLADHKPVGEHYYLGVVATDPRYHGQGLASATLAPVLAAADGAGLPSYLETGTERNVPYYERRGFAVDAEVLLPDGPRVWWMHRPAGCR